MADAYLETLTDSEKLFDAIVAERAFEFCGEHVRKADLIRWNLLKKKIDQTKVKMYDLRESKGSLAWLPKEMYYKVNPADCWELLIYGLSEGETDNPGSGWTKRTNHFAAFDDANVSSTDKLTVTKIESIYANDPDTRQFWPIPANAVTNSRGTIKNDYGY